VESVASLAEVGPPRPGSRLDAGEEIPLPAVDERTGSASGQPV